MVNKRHASRAKRETPYPFALDGVYNTDQDVPLGYYGGSDYPEMEDADYAAPDDYDGDALTNAETEEILRELAADVIPERDGRNQAAEQDNDLFRLPINDNDFPSTMDSEDLYPPIAGGFEPEEYVSPTKRQMLSMMPGESKLNLFLERIQF